MSARLLRPTGRRLCHVESVWGTAVTLDVRDPDGSLPTEPAVEDAVARAVGELHWVDEVFSTYRTDSAVSRLRRGELTPATLDVARPSHEALMQVVEQCRFAHQVTDGAFDPWSTPGGFDPSGLVKGWATQRVADLLVDAGVRHVSVNAGGDVATRGLAAPATPWRIGVRHPDRERDMAAVVAPGEAMVATSGLYERGAHVRHPVTGAPATGARSATVVGPDGGLADALATALLVAGREGAPWFRLLPGWSAFVVDPRPADTAWTVGPAFQG